MPGILLLLLILPLMLLLHRYGLLSTEVTTLSVGSNWGLRTWWKGSYRTLSGTLSRCFLLSQDRDALRIQVEQSAGMLSIEVKDRDGTLLHTWQSGPSADHTICLDPGKRVRMRVIGENVRGRFVISAERANQAV